MIASYASSALATTVRDIRRFIRRPQFVFSLCQSQPTQYFSWDFSFSQHFHLYVGKNVEIGLSQQIISRFIIAYTNKKWYLSSLQL